MNVVRAAVLDSTGTPQPLPVETDSDLAEVDPNGQPKSEDLGNGLGKYRVVGTWQGRRAPWSSLACHWPPVDQTVQQLAVIITVVALVGLLAAGFIAAFIISVSLRPLRRVAGTATQSRRNAAG